MLHQEKTVVLNGNTPGMRKVLEVLRNEKKKHLKKLSEQENCTYTISL